MTNSTVHNRFNPLVSIVIPVFNGSNYLKEAIDSALEQTYKNIEIIIINDGSTDNTEQIVKKYGKRIRYFQKENGGVATALNMGILKMKGEYFSWLSHDDVYFPNKIERQIEFLRSIDPKERFETVIYSDYLVINESSKEIGRTEFSLNHDQQKLNSSLYPLFYGLVHGCTLLISKNCLNKYGLFNPKLKTTQDYDLWFKMFPNYQIRYIPELLIKSRAHAKQGSKLIIASKECDELWIKIITHARREDINFMAGGLIPFYQDLLVLATAVKYTDVVKFLQKQLKQYKKRKESKILVSVILPFSNNIAYVKNALGSALSQSHKNVEIILIDDCTTEDISEIKSLARKNSKIKYIRNAKSKGLPFSRNLGIKNAEGEYLSFLDSKDLFEKKKISKQLKFMLKNLAMVTHTSYKELSKNSKDERTVLAGEISYKYPDMINSASIALSTVMAHRDVFHAKEDLFSKEKIKEDYSSLWTKLSRKYPIIGLNKILAKVR